MDLDQLQALANALGLEQTGILDTQYGQQVTFPASGATGPQVLAALDQPIELARVSLPRASMARAWEVAWSVESALVRLGIEGTTTIPGQRTVGTTRIRVRWGTGAAAHVVELDAWPGGSLSVTAQQVSLAVVPRIADAQSGTFSFNEQFTIAGTIAPAPGKRRSVVYMTSPLGLVTGGAAAVPVTVAVPAFTRRYTLKFATSGSDSWTVQELRGLAAPPPTPISTLGFADAVSVRRRPGVFVPLAQQANLLRVTSGTEGSVQAAIIWELEI